MEWGKEVNGVAVLEAVADGVLPGNLDGIDGTVGIQYFPRALFVCSIAFRRRYWTPVAILE